MWVGLHSPEGQPGQLLRLDRRTGERLDTFTLAEGVGPIAATPDALFVVKRDINTLARVEPGAAEPADCRRRLPGPLRSMRYASGTLYMIFQDEDTIARVSTNGHGMLFGSAGHRPSQARARSASTSSSRPATTTPCSCSTRTDLVQAQSRSASA